MTNASRALRLFSSALIGLIAVLSLTVASSAFIPASANHTRTNQQNPLVGWGASNTYPSAWSYYDSKGHGSTDKVDWGASYMFWNDAEVDKIKTAMCNGGVPLAYGKFYCGVGVGQGMRVIETDGTTSWDDDSGKKLGQPGTDYLLGCPNVYREHMRLYGPRPNFHSVQDRFYHPSFGYFVIGTTHLDFNDSPGCSNRHNGWPDVAENWFAGPLDAASNLTVAYECCNMWANSDASHVLYGVNDAVLGGTATGTVWDHHYGNNAIQTKVRVD